MINKHDQFAVIARSHKNGLPFSPLALGLASLGIGISLGTGLFFVRKYLSGTTQVNRELSPSGTLPWERVRAISMDGNTRLNAERVQLVADLDAFFMSNTGSDDFSGLAFSDNSSVSSVSDSDSTRSRFWTFSDDVPLSTSQQPAPIQEPEWLSLLRQPADVPQTHSEDVSLSMSQQPAPIQEPDWLSLLKQPVDVSRTRYEGVPQTRSRHAFKAVRLITMAGATQQD